MNEMNKYKMSVNKQKSMFLKEKRHKTSNSWKVGGPAERQSCLGIFGDSHKHTGVLCLLPGNNRADDITHQLSVDSRSRNSQPTVHCPGCRDTPSQRRLHDYVICLQALKHLLLFCIEGELKCPYTFVAI